MAKARRKTKSKVVSLPRVAFGAKSQKIELVEMDDPYTLEPGGKITVPRNLTAIADLEKRGFIDEAQRRAGEIFAENFENAELGGAQGIDYTKERVDSSPVFDGLSELQQAAINWLRDMARNPGIGKNGYAILRAICGENKSVSSLAQRVGGVGYGIGSRLRAQEGYVRLRLVEALDCIVEELDLKARGPSRAEIRAETVENLPREDADRLTA